MFTASKKTNKDKQPSKAKTCTCTSKCEEKEDDEEGFSDGEYANLTRKLKIGKGKFKGKLPLICFDCGEVGHFAAKCPHKNEAITNGKKGPRKFTSKERQNSLRKVSSPKNIVPNLKKIVIMKKNSTKYCYLWPNTINKRYLMKKEMNKKK